MTANNNPQDPNKGTKEETMAVTYHDTIFNPAWRAELFAEANKRGEWSKANPNAKLGTSNAAKMAQKLVEVAGLDEFDLAVLNLPRDWKDRLPLDQYSRLVAAVVLGGVGIPAAFKASLLKGEVGLAGKFSAKFPKVFAQHLQVMRKPEAKHIVLETTGRFPKYIIFGNLGAKDQNAWLKLAEAHRINVVTSADELMRHFYDNVEVSLAQLSAFIRLHFPVVDAQTANLKFVRNYDDVINVRVVEDKRFANFHEFAINGETLKKYTALSGKLDGLHPYLSGDKETHDGRSAIKTFMLVLLHVLSGKGKRGMLGRLAYLTDAWMEKETGAYFGDRTEAIRQGKVATLAVQSTKGFGLHLVNGSGEDRKAVAMELSRMGIPSICHHQMSWLTAGIGAEARGVGMTKRLNKMGQLIDTLVMFSRPDKATKMANRVSLAKPTAYVEGMVKAALKILLSTGEAVALDGIKTSVAYANCGLLTNGSGPAISRPDFTIKVFCPKQTFKTEIVLGLDCDQADAEKAAVEGLEFPESGKTGDALIIWHGEARSTFTLFNAEFKRVEAGKWSWNKETRRLEVSVVVSWSYTTQTEKLVADGIKARIAPEVLAITATDTGATVEQPQVFLTHEELKGTQGLVAMWAESKEGGVVLDPNTGLTAEQQAEFSEWVKDNTKMVTIRRQINSIQYANLRKLYIHKSGYKFQDDNWVEWTGEAIFGEVVLAVEYSTTFQAEGTSELFPELMYSLAILSTGFNYLWHEKTSVNRRSGFSGLSYMAQNEAPTGINVPVIDALAEDAEILSKDEIQDMSHGREYIKALAKKYPAGFYVELGSQVQYVNPAALQMLLGKAGTLNAVVSNVVDLVKYFVIHPDRRPGRSMVEQISSYMKLIRKAATAMLTAGNVMKKPFRTGSMLTRKVAPTSRFGVEAWELHVNPADPRVLDGTLVPGQIVGANRVPVVFWGALKVVLNDKTPIGVFEIDAYCWAAINEGDGDGDTIAVLLLPNCLKVNNGTVLNPQQMLWDACHTVYPGGITTRLSASGLWVKDGVVTPLTGGYAAMYGNNFENHPYADFLREAEKKEIQNLVLNADKTGVFNCMELPVFHNPEVMSYEDLVNGIFKHYRQFVGSSYGIATVALYLLSIAQEKGWNELKQDLIPLVVFCGRFMHEGKHLGGMNENATRFWDGLNSVVHTGSIRITNALGTETELQGIVAMRTVVEEFLGGNEIAEDGLHLTDSQLLLLRDIRKIVIVGDKVDRETEDTKFGTEKFQDFLLADWARIFRLCRLVGKGTVTRLGEHEKLSDAAAIRSALENETGGHALTDRLSADHIYSLIGDTLLGKVAAEACEIHGTVVDTVRKQIIEDESATPGSDN